MPADQSHLVASGVSASEYSDEGLDAATTYYYVVTAEDTSGNESPASGEVNATTEESTGESGDLVLQYRDGDYGSPSNNQVKPHFNIVNAGDTDVDLSELTIRYWYTIDGEQSQAFHCDYARVGCGNVQRGFPAFAIVRGRSGPLPGDQFYFRSGNAGGRKRNGRNSGSL